MIAPIKNLKQEKLNFPTKWQAVIFRNYGYVSTCKIAKTLNCTCEIVEDEAKKLGLSSVKYNEDWEKKGYLTIIRNNWFLLNYEQLCTLMGYSMEKLENLLEKEDFLWVKLGFYKPFCEKIVYSPLTDEENEKTSIIRKIVETHIIGEFSKPFDFFSSFDKEKKNSFKNAKGKRILHGYLCPCGDVFMKDSKTYLCDNLLCEYQLQGVNGIWLHGVLSELSYYPFDETMSLNYETRRKNLTNLVERAEKYGIKIYLYLNEPRGLLKKKFVKFPHLMGRTEGEMAGFCFEKKEVQNALYNAIKDLFSFVPKLGGIISITMSENLTHCNYRPETDCQICKNIPPEESAAKVNNVIFKALKDSGSNGELIANLWGWSPFMGWSEGQTMRGIELLDKDISVLCVSEYDLEICKGGVKGRVIDYSLSNEGPSEISKKALLYAKKLGHKTYAKIQINNSWEMPIVPYLPVYDTVYNHLKNLNKIGVNDFMLTWTLGGYPSPMMNLVASYSKSPEEFNLEKWYRNIYGENAKIVQRAVKEFCRGFKEYPFSVDVLYYSPKTLGASNLWDESPMEKQSAMVSYSFDDFENWIKPYPIKIYINQFEKLLKIWENGLKILEDATFDEKIEKIKLYMKVAYNHIYNDVLQTKFVFFKRNYKKYIKQIKQILNYAESSAKEMIYLLRKDATIGYEASNHYFYTDRNLIEKIIQVNKLKEIYNN